MVGKGKKQQPKQVVYLLGAGATQAEVDYLGARPINLLMRDDPRLGEGISTRILRQTGSRWRSFLGDDQSFDIEKLISLLTASGVHKLSSLADEMRRRYFEEICASLVAAKVVERPHLAIALLEMHSKEVFRNEVETLTGLLTTNHDGLLQIASKEVFAAVDLGFPFGSQDFTEATSGVIPPVLQLHGSFTWKFAVPINVARLGEASRYSSEATWIPPTILKEAKDYPFNKIMGLAYELLSKQCDVLRVIGASLTQNDWNVVSLIFNAQRHKELARGRPFRVELIMPHEDGEAVKKECSYLKNMTPIGYLTDGQFADYKERHEGDHVADSDMNNVFAYWLKEKITYHRKRNDFGDDALGAAMAQIAGEVV